VRFCFENPIGVVEQLDRLMADRTWAELLPNAHFLRTHRLNQDLYDFLLVAGYEPQDVDFILRLDKVRPPGPVRGPDTKWERYYTPELRSFVRNKERLLFAMFPEFDD
jgi:hypothetical protein